MNGLSLSQGLEHGNEVSQQYDPAPFAAILVETVSTSKMLSKPASTFAEAWRMDYNRNGLGEPATWKGALATSGG